MNILIISTNAIGDTYISTAAIDALKSKYGPETQFSFITSIKAKEVVGCILECEIYTVKSHSIIELLKSIFWLRRKQFDLVFQFIPGIFNSILFTMSKSKGKIGFMNYLPMNDWHNKSLKLRTVGFRNSKMIWTDNVSYLKLIELCLSIIGCDPKLIHKPKMKGISIGKSNIAYIVIHPISTRIDRSLNLKSIQKISKYFKSKRFEIFVVCSNEDLIGAEKQIEENASLLRNLSASELASFIQDSSLFIGVDSFPLHIADAYDNSFIGIFGPTKPNVVLEHPKKSIQLMTSDIDTYDSDIILNKIIEVFENVVID